MTHAEDREASLILTCITQPAILKPGSKQTCIKRPNRDELSFLMVLALPKASKIVLASRICCWTQVEMLAVTLEIFLVRGFIFRGRNFKIIKFYEFN